MAKVSFWNWMNEYMPSLVTNVDFRAKYSFSRQKVYVTGSLVDLC